MSKIGEHIIFQLEGAIENAKKVNDRVDERLHEIDSDFWATIQDHEIREMFDRHLKELEDIRQEINEGINK
ncbi:hypothetical protein [Halobacillus naozhouensis]|uniref:Phage protein n=1 Tax=Halobacillus naozhouensis TaxID=554880 RepID=A0ABY8IV64_9BACI|nr:hypothetical protein [Halobacillus naozhouensis]WFT73059.1 hypothetical protein P9989_11625 [Halobacillus naozhouensis]